MDTPLISIIVPVYKVEPYLRKCVDSILAQTYTNIEVILVDDGSPDGCPAICDEYGAKDSRVVVIHQENAGVSAARNTGLDAAKGKYIGFVDGDDWIEPDMYELLYHVITSSGADIAEASYTTCDNKHTKAAPDKYISFSSNEAMSRILRGQWELLCVWNKLFDRNVIGKISFDSSLTQLDDGNFSIQAIALSTKIAVTDEQCYHYTIREDSASHAFSDSFWTTLDGADLIIDVIKGYDCDFADAADKCAVQHGINIAKASEEKGRFSKYAAEKVASNIRKHNSKSVWKLLSFSEKCWVCLLLFGQTPFIAGMKLWRNFMRLKSKL